MIETVDAWIRSLGGLGYFILGLSALLEYLVPPFPGDTVTLLGGAYVARGDRSLFLVMASVMVGSLAGIAATWGLGRFLGNKLDASDPQSTFLGITWAQLHAAQKLMREKGAILLLLNRFFPSARMVFLVAAGASGMSLSKTLALGAVSALAWNILLVLVGRAIGDNVERIEWFFGQYRLYAMVAVGVLACGFLVWKLSVRRPRA
jgi:membrane protein DedA with SNARE-associated domain